MSRCDWCGRTLDELMSPNCNDLCIDCTGEADWDDGWSVEFVGDKGNEAWAITHEGADSDWFSAAYWYDSKDEARFVLTRMRQFREISTNNEEEA